MTKHADACKKAMRMVGAPGVRAGAPWDRALALALTEMVFAEIQESGDRMPMPYLPLAPHLGGEAEMRGLVASTASKDKLLRADLYEWATKNRETVDHNVGQLKPLALAYLDAKKILDDEPGPDEEERVVHTMMATIIAYANHNFGVDLRDVQGRDVDAWCANAMREQNPTPEWVYTGGVEVKHEKRSPVADLVPYSRRYDKEGEPRDDDEA